MVAIHPTAPVRPRVKIDNREVKFDVYGKRQTANGKLLPSVFSSLYSRIKIFVSKYLYLYLYLHLEKLLRLQKRAVRLINFAPFRSHAVPYFLHSNIMPITMLYFKLSSILMFDVYNNTAPHNISHLFIPTQKIHSYSTRSSSSGNYYISHSRLNQKNDSFSIMGAKIWNSIPENLRNSSKSLFKEKVQATLLKIFEVQDRYADLNTIISDFKNY